MQISIQPILSNINSYQTQKNKPTIHTQNINRLPNIYYTPIYFGCNKCEKQTFQNQLENLSGVHCPSCGTVMLNKLEYENLLEQAKNIKNPLEFVDFLNENNKYISPAYSNLMKNFNKLVQQNPNIDFNELLAITKSIENKRIVNHIEKDIENLNKLIAKNKLSENDKQLILLCITQLNDFKNSDKKDISYTKYKEILTNTLLKTEYEKKFDLYSRTKEKFIQKTSERFILNLANNLKTPEEKAYQLIKNIFENSVSKYYEIDRNNKNSELHFNKILLCQNCQQNDATINNMLHGNDVKKENYNQYIDDIAEKTVNDEIDDIMYPITLNGYISKISKKNLNRNSSPSLKQLRTKIFYQRGPLDFDLTAVEGIPCACCGKPTITHNKKLDIFEQIEHVQSNEDYLKIIEENKEFIRDRYLPITNYLEYLLSTDLSDKEIIDELRRFGANYLNHKLQQNVDYMNYIISINRHSPDNNKYIKQFIETVNKDFLNLPSDKQFPFTEYQDLINSTIKLIDGKIKHKYIDRLRFSIKNVYAANHVLYPPPNVYNKYGSPLKIILQDIFKSSVATKDHFVARHNFGSNDETNLIVLCKGCNTYKSDAKTDSWLRRTPQFKYNIQKQADFIQDKVNKGELDRSHIKYLSNLQENLYFITNGEVEIELNFDDFNDNEDFML